MKEFNLICAVALNGVIGDSETNSIPWYLPTDLNYFKAKTLGKTIIMGSRTFESIGKPLQNRRNVVISRNHNTDHFYGIDETYKSVQDAIKSERPKFFIIGGAHIYGEAIKYSPTKLYITIVKIRPEGDVQFPIAGERFLQDTITTSTGILYKCVKRSGWLKENDIEFQFTEFGLNDTSAH